MHSVDPSTAVAEGDKTFRACRLVVILVMDLTGPSCPDCDWMIMWMSYSVEGAKPSISCLNFPRFAISSVPEATKPVEALIAAAVGVGDPTSTTA
jgi:hypothetical protein